MIKCTLRLELMAGDGPEECASAIIAVADKLDLATVAEFNGVDMKAFPGEAAAGVLLRFEQLRRLTGGRRKDMAPSA